MEGAAGVRTRLGAAAGAALFLLAAPAHSAAFNETLAVWYANLAGAAYCDNAVLASWTCGPKCAPGMARVSVCEGSVTSGFVGRGAGGKCVVSFKGTSNTEAAGLDLDYAPQVDYHGALVHPGFLGEWRKLKSCIEVALEDRGCGQEEDPIGLTGHSLGGALAAVAAFDFGMSGSFSVSEVYTFGMPRVGSSEFADKFEHLYQGSFFRVAHTLDPFVSMPPRWVVYHWWPFHYSYEHLYPEVLYPGHVDSLDCKICLSRDSHCPKASSWLNVGFNGMGWHHHYMGVEMAQAGCESPVKLNCTDDIPDSWCGREWGFMIKCNKDQRGPNVSCNQETGKCRCIEGSCPVLGRCRMPGEAAAPSPPPLAPYPCETAGGSDALPAARPPGGGAPLAGGATAWCAGLACAAVLLLGAAARTRRPGAAARGGLGCAAAPPAAPCARVAASLEDPLLRF